MLTPEMGMKEKNILIRFKGVLEKKFKINKTKIDMKASILPLICQLNKNFRQWLLNVYAKRYFEPVDTLGQKYRVLNRKL